MSDTIVDMPKVTQMLDAGWMVRISKNEMGSYFCGAVHENDEMMDRVRKKVCENIEDFEMHHLAKMNALETDDFTPEQALTRLAYKLMGGEVI